MPMLYRTRTVRSVIQSVKPIISKHTIDFQADGVEVYQRFTGRNRNYYAPTETVLDRIISKLRSDGTPADFLLMITPASRHPNLYKLHVINRKEGTHLGMTTITQNELSRLRSSKAFQRYCIVFGSRYMDLREVVFETGTIKSLVNILNKECCSVRNICLESKLGPLNINESNTSSAGDFFNNQTKTEIVKYQDSFVQTDPEVEEYKNVPFTISDILTLIETINETLQPSKQDIDRFFSLADKMNFKLVVRPELLWKASPPLGTCNKKEEIKAMTYQVESYVPGVCYLGSISLEEEELLNELHLHPNLLLNIHVILDVFELTPLPRLLVNVLRKIFTFFKLELFYDALGEFVFNCFKNSTHL